MPNLTYLLPQDVQKFLENHAAEASENLSLILSRYVPQEVIDNRDVPDERRRKWRDKWFQELLSQFEIAERNGNREWVRLWQAQYVRWQAQTEGTERFRGTALSRMILGLGSESVLETGITVQYITGLPIIPGSSLKGLARAYALYTIAEKLGMPAHLQQFALRELGDWIAAENGEAREKAQEGFVKAVEPHEVKDAKDPFKQAVKNDGSVDVPTMFALLSAEDELGLTVQAFRAVFGSNDKAGMCIFHHAVVADLPFGTRLYDVDVMTPHFGRYYKSIASGNLSKPDDADDPNPVLFLTTGQGITWHFAIGLRRGGVPAASDFAKTWLKGGLTELGVGGKTAAGYGVFSVDE